MRFLADLGFSTVFLLPLGLKPSAGVQAHSRPLLSSCVNLSVTSQLIKAWFRTKPSRPQFRCSARVRLMRTIEIISSTLQDTARPKWSYGPTLSTFSWILSGDLRAPVCFTSTSMGWLSTQTSQGKPVLTNVFRTPSTKRESGRGVRDSYSPPEGRTCQVERSASMMMVFIIDKDFLVRYVSKY